MFLRSSSTTLLKLFKNGGFSSSRKFNHHHRHYNNIFKLVSSNYTTSTRRNFCQNYLNLDTSRPSEIDPETIRSIHQRVQEYSSRVQQAKDEKPNASFLTELNEGEQKDLASCYNNLGYYCLQQLNKPKEALFYFLQSIQFNYNNDPIILFNAASLFEREGKRPDSAAELYMRAIRIDPYFVDAKVHLARIFSSHETEESSRFQAAEYLFTDLYKTHNHLGAMIELAMLYSRKGDHSEEYREKTFQILDELLLKLVEEPNYIVDFKEMDVKVPQEYSQELISNLDAYMKGFRNSDKQELLLQDPAFGATINIPYENDGNGLSLEIADISYRYHAQDNETVTGSDVINTICYLLKQFKRERDAKSLFDQVIKVIEKDSPSKEAYIVDSSTLSASMALSEDAIKKIIKDMDVNEKAKFYMNCAILSNGMGQVDESISLLERAFDMTKGKDTQIIACMALYMQEKSPQVSDLLFKRVISLEPTEFQHYIAYSSFLHHQSRTKDALSLLERTIKKYPQMKEQLEKQMELIRDVNSSGPGNMADLFGNSFSR
ncbi:predicted protein [Naegleria gruberi]|uniref:Predicted protein n=1 Tax=Naegleria gruberi TaxID=5762 RepID=D2V2G8_NAEGR|nr:uncharacterized protein NAEGRDRAFT_46164 [Naegleria gruberi]EFC49055.1 predicted protein [Naegleria gruberi]|eukprot:XP_002681799.1 predicted protein [Naegleria gruberi strain NEG-M]